MIIFPNCKVNLGLRILRKRPDGYHDIESVFYPLPLYDVLEGIRATAYGIRDAGNNQDESSIQYSNSGFSITGPPDDNLCIKAYKLLKKDFPQLPRIQMHLHKSIPAGAGLGGGSADGAFTLELLNKQFELNLSTSQLINYALQLGSDCPFFIINKTCLATGRGEILEQLTIDLSDYKFLVVNCGIHINTANAFSGVTPALPSRSLKEIVQQPLKTWKTALINDFEKNVFSQHPEIEAIKKKLYHGGSLYASLSGSGSSVYGIFEKNIVPEINFPSHYYVKELFS